MQELESRRRSKGVLLDTSSPVGKQETGVAESALGQPSLEKHLQPFLEDISLATVVHIW